MLSCLEDLHYIYDKSANGENIEQLWQLRRKAFRRRMSSCEQAVAHEGPAEAVSEVVGKEDAGSSAASDGGAGEAAAASAALGAEAAGYPKAPAASGSPPSPQWQRQPMRAPVVRAAKQETKVS